MHVNYNTSNQSTWIISIKKIVIRLYFPFSMIYITWVYQKTPRFAKTASASRVGADFFYHENFSPLCLAQSTKPPYLCTAKQQEASMTQSSTKAIFILRAALLASLLCMIEYATASKGGRKQIETKNGATIVFDNIRNLRSVRHCDIHVDVQTEGHQRRLLCALPSRQGKGLAVPISRHLEDSGLNHACCNIHRLAVLFKGNAQGRRIDYERTRLLLAGKEPSTDEDELQGGSLDYEAYGDFTHPFPAALLGYFFQY